MFGCEAGEVLGVVMSYGGSVVRLMMSHFGYNEGVNGVGMT